MDIFKGKSKLHKMISFSGKDGGNNQTKNNIPVKYFRLVCFSTPLWSVSMNTNHVTKLTIVKGNPLAFKNLNKYKNNKKKV